MKIYKKKKLKRDKKKCWFREAVNWKQKNKVKNGWKRKQRHIGRSKNVEREDEENCVRVRCFKKERGKLNLRKDLEKMQRKKRRRPSENMCC